MAPNLKKHTLPVEGSVDSKKLELMVLNVVLFCLLSRYQNIAECLPSAVGPA